MKAEYLFSTNPSFLLTRLIEQYKKQNKLIIAYDIDDTVRPFYCADCSDVQSMLRMAKNTLNAFFIVFTSNPDIEGVKEFLEKNNLPYDAINENAPFVPFKDGKIFYNVLLDDKAGLGETVNTLKQLLYLVRNDLINKKEEKLEWIMTDETREVLNTVLVCPHCQFETVGYSKFCSECGKPLSMPKDYEE